MSPLVVRVDSRIRIPLSGIGTDVAMAIRKSCEHDNPEFSKKRALGYATYNVPAIIKTWRVEGEELTVPRGAMQRVRRHLKHAGIAYKVVDARVEGSFMTTPLRYVGHDPRDYQREATEAAVAREQGVIRAATGTGKTTTALLLASLVRVPTLIILPTVKLMQQTADVAAHLLGVEGDAVGVLQASKRRLRPLTVASQATLYRKIDPEIRDYFGAVIVDEAHHAAARTFAEVIDQFPARYRYAFTADERRKDKKEFLVYDAFGNVLHETDRARAESTGAVVDVEIRIVPTQFEAIWYTREPDFTKLVEQMTNDEKRNALAIRMALAELRRGEQAILLTHRREHARALDRALVAAGIRSGCMIGGTGADSAEFDKTRDGLRTKAVQAGVGTYEALGEGIDLPAVAVGIATTPIATNKQRFNQVRGRLCRPSKGKTHGRLYVLFDGRVFDERALHNILSWNKTVRALVNGEWVDARDKRHRRAIMRAA